MDCDGLKKELLTDLDGSFLSGTPGSTVIAQSEYQWGSQSRGLGDFRIPKEAISFPNGSYISPNTLYGNKWSKKSCMVFRVFLHETCINIYVFSRI